jgi:hypothetical protein
MNTNRRDTLYNIHRNKHKVEYNSFSVKVKKNRTQALRKVTPQHNYHYTVEQPNNTYTDMQRSQSLK